MKIVISPSKTMKKVQAKPKKASLFSKEKEVLLAKLKTYSVKDLEELYGSNMSIAKENFLRFKDFTEDALAIFSYTGAQFKALDVETISTKKLDFMNRNVYIISGLYGLLRPLDTIGLYRLPMGLRIEKPLKEYWKDQISNYLSNETILNLASKEYSDILDPSLNIITVDFLINKNGKLKKSAMEIKKQRGKLLRYITETEDLSLSNLKRYCQDNYVFNETMSDKKTIVFIKG